MVRRLSLVLMVIILGIFILQGPVQMSRAQDNPPTTLINAALADLSQRAGRTLTLNSLSAWTWTQSNYPDTSLGCPQAGGVYAQVLTNGYSFVFNYNGAVFDYRAAADGSSLFLCSGPATVPAAPAVSPTAPPLGPTATPEGRAVCADAMNTRLATGMVARVRATGLPVNVRNQPTASGAKVGQIDPGAAFDIVGTYTCAENLVWWPIVYGDVSGWAAEGANSVYWVEPTDARVTPPTATPSAQVAATPVAGTPVASLPEGAQVYALPNSPQAIRTDNTDQLDRFVELRVNEVVTGLAWSPDGQWIAMTTQDGLRLYNLLAIRQTPRTFQVPNGPTTAVAFNGDGSLLVTGHTDGTVRLWDISTGGLRGLLRAHSLPVRAVAFSPDGTRIATGGGDQTAGELKLWDAASQTQIATLQGHTAAILAVAFSPDGALLASASLDGTVRLWDVATASPGTILPESGDTTTAVTFSPDGSWLAFAGEAGIVRLWEIGPGVQMAMQGDAVVPTTALTFSPDGSLLVTAGGPALGSAGRLWNPATNMQIGPLPMFEDTPGLTTAAGVTFNPDGSMLAIALTTGNSGLVRILGISQ